MTDTSTIARAHALLAEYPRLPAVARLREARFTPNPEPDWIVELRADRATIIDGLDVKVTVTWDDHPDTSWLGEFSDTWKPGAVNHPHYSSSYPRTYRWFHPERTEDEHYQDLRSMKYGKREARDLARSYVARDLELALTMTPVVLIATVSKAGIILGTSSLGGIDDEEYALSWDMLSQVVDEAVWEAKAALTKLCPATTEEATP